MAYSAYQDWLDSFEIFSKYNTEPAQAELFAEENNIWAGPPRSVVSDEDNSRLESLGWDYDEKHSCYFRYAAG